MDAPPEQTITLVVRGNDPPEGRVVSAGREIPFTGWVALVGALGQLTAKDGAHGPAD